MGKDRGRKKKGGMLPPAQPARPPRPSDRTPENIAVSFRHVRPGGDGCLSRCKPAQVRQVIDTLRIVSSSTWLDLYRSAGLRPKEIPDHALRFQRPPDVMPDVAICSIRAGGKARIWWYRAHGVMHVLQFDPEHDATGR